VVCKGIVKPYRSNPYYEHRNIEFKYE
jgi:hypothetical protein